MRMLIGALLLCLSISASSGAGAAPEHPNVILIIADDMARDDCGAYGNPASRRPISTGWPGRACGSTGRLSRPARAARAGPASSRALSAQHRRRGAALAAAGRANHVRRKTEGRRLLDRRRRQVAPGQRRQRSVRRRARGRPVGIPTGRGAGREITDDRAGLRCGPERLRPVGSRAARPARATSRSSSGWPPSTHTATTSRRHPRPHRPEDVVVPPYLPDVPEVRKDLASTTMRSAASITTSAKCWPSWNARGSTGIRSSCSSATTAVPFPRCKTTLYDSGIATPFIVRWPGHIQPGSHCGRLVSTIDIAPTVLRLAGLEPGPSFQGKDFSPLFQGPDGEGPRPRSSPNGTGTTSRRTAGRRVRSGSSISRTTTTRAR